MYGIKIEYNDMNSTELYNRYISENAASSTSADVLWSSAMDLQMKLVNDGLMASYASPEASSIPQWAQYQQQAFGTTYEPLAIVYNKRLVPAGDVPQTRAALINLLQTQPAKYKGKITTYDIEKAGVGFNALTQDARVNPQMTWQLVDAIGATRPKLLSSTGAMMERISSGENLIGYNILGSYAFSRAKKDPVDWLCLSERLHAGGEPHRDDFEEGEAPQRSEIVGRLPAFNTRSDACSQTRPTCSRFAPTSTAKPPWRVSATTRRLAQTDPYWRRITGLSRPVQATRIPEAVAAGHQALNRTRFVPARSRGRSCGNPHHHHFLDALSTHRGNACSIQEQPFRRRS